MALSTSPYRGTRDFFPKEKRERDFLFEKMKLTAETFGYEPYDGPLLEDVELYAAKSGQELINEQIYSFNDRGGRFVAIRPEMTPTLARMVAQIHQETAKPIRWFSIPNLMRYERPQKGRLREHWQFNCDVFGAPGMQGELEILQVGIHLLESFGATNEHFEIQVNNRQIVDATFGSKMGLSNDDSYKLYKIVDKSKKVSKEALAEMVDAMNMSENSKNIFYEYLDLKNFDNLFSFLTKHGLNDALTLMEQFLSEAKAVGIASYLNYDPTVVRGLDYYTGLVFEIFDKHPDNRRAICGGGAYANLLKIFDGPALPGIGFGLGDVTLKDFLMTHGLLPDLSRPSTDLFLSYQVDAAHIEAMKLARALRQKGVRVITMLESVKIKKVFSLAESKGAKYVGLIGEDELAKGSVQIKNMQSKEQSNIDRNDIEAIRKIFE